jgi:hypothetical protein
VNVSQINNALRTGSFSNDELNSIVNSLKHARRMLGQAVKSKLQVGTKVKWLSTRHGGFVEGTVVKTAIKYVTVKTDEGLWRVPANMLEVV